MVFSLVSKLFSWYTDMFWKAVDTVKQTVAAFLTFIIILLVLLWMSIFLYGSFYYNYIPAESHVKDVNFYFSTNHKKSEGLGSFPEANLSLITDNRQQLLAAGQAYRIALDLEMPESPVNQALGMFMVNLSFYTRHGEIVHRASRSYKPALGVHIQVESRRIEIYSANLVIDAQFTGVRYILHRWPILSALFGISLNMTFLSLVALLSWYNLTQKSKMTDSTQPTLHHSPSHSVYSSINQDKKSDDHSSQGSVDSEDFTEVTAEVEKSELLQPRAEHRPTSEPENLSTMADKTGDSALRLRTGFPSST